MFSPPRQPTPKTASRILTAILLAGLVLRLVSLLNTPCLTDEAFTFWRISGSFNQLIDNLLGDAFLPLHYDLVWLSTQLFGQSLWAMRLPATIAGVAMPWAIYRLGRLIGGRRVGLYSAAIAAGCAFLCFFARNAKMYMPAWTLFAFALGSLLWMARCRQGSRGLPALTFILLGMASVSMHAVMCIPLALSPLVAIARARRRRLKTFAFATLGTIILLAPAAIYYTSINTWFQGAGGLSGYGDDGPTGTANGLMWVARWQMGRSPFNTLQQCLSAYVAGIEWPPDGMWYRSTLNPLAENARAFTGYLTIALFASAFLAVAAWIARGKSNFSLGHALLLVLLIAVPFYGFYLRSFRSFQLPWQMGWPGWLMVAIVSLLLALQDRRRPLRRRVGTAFVWLGLTFLILSLEWLALRFAYARAPLDATGLPRWNPLWVTRYSGFVAPLLCVGVGGIVAAVPARVLRLAMLLAVLGVNLWISLLSVTRQTEIPWPQIIRDVRMATHHGGLPVVMEWVDSPGEPFLADMPSPYFYLVQQTGLKVDPPSFRTGTTWPYQPGPAVRSIEASLAYETNSSAKLRADSNARQMILWRSSRPLGRDAAPPDGWRAVDTQNFDVFAVWTWQRVFGYQRVVLERP